MTNPIATSATESIALSPSAHVSSRPVPFEALLGRHAGNVIFTNLFGLAVLLFLAWACIIWDSAPSVRLGYALTGLTGMLLGWACGMYFAPYGAIERTKFVTVGQAVSAFASGYLVSKIDRFVEARLFPASEGASGDWFGAALFVAAFLNAALVVYSNRSYFREH